MQIWDTTKCKLIKNLGGHESRIGAIAWSSKILSSGSRDKTILNRDLRVAKDYIGKLVGHK
jgi:cell division cycle 20-like protein 1 (cofactor of APC complex)